KRGEEENSGEDVQAGRIEPTRVERLRHEAGPYHGPVGGSTRQGVLGPAGGAFLRAGGTLRYGAAVCRNGRTAPGREIEAMRRNSPVPLLLPLLLFVGLALFSCARKTPAPAPLSEADQIARGHYLVTVTGCNDC